MVLVASLDGCGGKIDPSAGGAASLSAPTTEYCASLVKVARHCSGEPCTDAAALCEPSAASASDAYTQAYVECVGREGSNLDEMCGYPSSCVVDALRSAVPTAAQIDLAGAFCTSCTPGAKTPGDRAECQRQAFVDRGPGETLGFALLALSDAQATRALECESAEPAPRYCTTEFITCLAKYRPIVANGCR